MAFGEAAGWFDFFSELPRYGGGCVLSMASENVRVSGSSASSGGAGLKLCLFRRPGDRSEDICRGGN